MSGNMMDVPLRVIDLLRHAERNHSTVEIVSRRLEGDIHRYSYGDAYRRVCRLARALENLGAAAGTHIATLAWNGYRHLELYYATAGIGAVCHTLNPRLTLDQLAWICNDARDEILCFDIGFAPMIRDLAPRLETVRTFVLLGDEQAVEAAEVDGLLGYERLIKAQPDRDIDWPDVDERSVCGLCYTSGTTGRPKGVAYTHRSTILHSYASALPDALNLSARETVLPIVPMFHVNAWGFPYSLPMVGAKMVLPGRDLDGRSLYELCEAESVTFAVGVPVVWLGLVEHMRTSGQRFSTLSRASIGGAAPSETLVRTLEADHDIRVVHGWGMTETSPIATFSQFTAKHAGWSEEDRFALQTKQGREVFGIELRLESPDGHPLPRDGRSCGHLLVRGPWVAARYQGGIAGARDDGWFDTGDIATIDPDGYMRIVDRAKDIIKSGGEWISSAELEKAAMAHEAVLEAAVLGVPDPKWDERPLLLCVLKAGHTVDADGLRAHLLTRVARWWVPERIEFVDSLPHGGTGKILKDALRARFASKNAPPRIAPSNDKEL